MTRQEALDWLNYRLEVDHKMGRNSHFTLTDLNFFMYFIKERTGKDVHINSLINSIRHHSDSCMEWVERLMNDLFYTYKIETVLDTEDIFLNMSLGLPKGSRKILKYI